jgi:hypothetical protein
MCGPLTKTLYLRETRACPEKFREPQVEKQCVGSGIKETCRISVGWGVRSHKINLCLYLVPRIQKLPEVTLCKSTARIIFLVKHLKIPPKIPRLLFITEVHCLNHNSPSLRHTLSQLNPGHNVTLYTSLRSNIIATYSDYSVDLLYQSYTPLPPASILSFLLAPDLLRSTLYSKKSVFFD